MIGFLREGWQWKSHAFGRGLQRTARPSLAQIASYLVMF
jgi:hypothetical protein